MAKEIVRKEPDKKYRGQPCSVTCVGTAYDHIHTWPFTIIKPEGMRYDGYLRLRDMNQFAREYLPIAKRIDFKKNERPRLKEFLQTNETRCCICVLGHYLYADTQTYWSFFDNDDALNKICDTSVVFDVNNLYLTALLRILKEELNDRADIIQWWLYEDVRKCIWYDFQDGRRMRYDMPTAETLYDYLTIPFEKLNLVKEEDEKSDICGGES